MEQDRNVPWRFRLALFGLGIAAWIAQAVVSTRPDLVERIYARGIYPWVSEIVGTLTGWTSYSLVELAAIPTALGFGFAIYRALRAVARKRRALGNVLGHAFSKILAWAGLLYLSGMALWGLNYYRQPFLVTENLDASSADAGELRAVCLSLVEEANALRQRLEEDEDGVMATAGRDRAVLRRASRAFAAPGQEYGVLRDGFVSRPKSPLLPLLPWLNISGVFFPYTSEAHVGMEQPEHDRMFAACHELSHQLGWAREEEANFVGYAVCRRHPDAEYRYAAAQGALRYALSALRRIDPDAGAAVVTTFGDGLRRDWDASRRFWERYDTLLGNASLRVNDAYLKAQGQEQGIASYGLMVDLLVADRRRLGS